MSTLAFLPSIRNLAAAGEADAALLVRFTTDRDEAAFTEIVRRHGRMVLEVCRCVLHNHADVEDAFQATFLILARDPGSIRKADSLASWLHGVAYRTARKALASALRRRRFEARAARPIDPNDRSWGEVQQVLHEELRALPGRLRGVLVLCYLEGRTQDQAAATLNVSRAAVKKRLERGRDWLRTRLARRGLGSATILVALASPSAVSALPRALAASTVRAAILFAGGRIAAIHSPLLALAAGGQTMLLTRFTIALGFLTAALVGMALAGSSDQPPTPSGIALPSRNTPSTAATDDRSPSLAEREKKWLAGEWTVRHVETNGEARLSKDQLQDARVIFESDKAELKNLEVSFVNNFSFKLDPDKKPKEIDVTFLEGEMKGKTFEGIYILRQNEMRICLRLMGTQFGRPKGFVTNSGTTLYTFILEPVKKKDPPPVEKKK